MKKENKKHKKFISSSEFGQWAFCPRQWYLMKMRRKRINTSPIRRGNEFHMNMSHGIKAAQKAQSRFKTFCILGVIVCIFWYLS